MLRQCEPNLRRPLDCRSCHQKALSCSSQAVRIPNDTNASLGYHGLFQESPDCHQKLCKIDEQSATTAASPAGVILRLSRFFEDLDDLLISDQAVIRKDLPLPRRPRTHPMTRTTHQSAMTHLDGRCTWVQSLESSRTNSELR